MNHAPGMRDHFFFGWQGQRELNKKFTLGAEWFNPGRDSLAVRNPQIANAGGLFNFNENFSLLFTVGHTVRGDAHTVAYLGLYWMWGRDKRQHRGSLVHAVYVAVAEKFSNDARRTELELTNLLCNQAPTP